MIKTEVDAGVCGFTTQIVADSPDMQTVHLNIKSECTDVQKAAEELKEINGMEEAFGKIGTTKAYEIAAQYCRHAACPVPMAIVKTVEAASGLALPKNVSVSIEKVVN
jgi:hypothetical protein